MMDRLNSLHRRIRHVGLWPLRRWRPARSWTKAAAESGEIDLPPSLVARAFDFQPRIASADGLVDRGGRRSPPSGHSLSFQDSVVGLTDQPLALSTTRPVRPANRTILGSRQGTGRLHALQQCRRAEGAFARPSGRRIYRRPTELSRPAGSRTPLIELDTLTMKLSDFQPSLVTLRIAWAPSCHGEERIRSGVLQRNDLGIYRRVRGFISDFP
ncbi:hypothetical protein ACVIW0_007406 [Bradyrhizobium sp. USDA 4454]